MRVVVGSRASQLSLIQARVVVDELRRVCPGVEVEVRTVRTLGDRTRKPLLEIKRKGIFEKEVDAAVLRGEVDLAVHSLKDVPTELAGDLVLAAVPKRGLPHDALVSKGGLGLDRLPLGARVGTDSPRRRAQLLRARPDLRVESMRGNVDTRVKKLDAGTLDAIVVAEEGLRRLGLANRVAQRLPLEDFTPAPGQGAIAVVAKRESTIAGLLAEVNHQPSMAEVLAERALVRELGGGCKVPLGAVARAGDGLGIYASVLSPDGRVKVSASVDGSLTDPEGLGKRAARELLNQGADELLGAWGR